MNVLEEFDLLVEPYNKYPVVKRICPSCAATHTESQTYLQVIGWSGPGAWNGAALSWSKSRLRSQV